MSKIKVNEIEKASGSGITVPTGTSFTITDGLAVSSLPTVTVAKGGTNLTSFTAGDILYATGSTTLAKLPKGTASQTLKMNAGATAPEWATVAAATSDFVKIVSYDVSSTVASFNVVNWINSAYKFYIVRAYLKMVNANDYYNVRLVNNSGSTVSSGYAWSSRHWYVTPGSSSSTNDHGEHSGSSWRPSSTNQFGTSYHAQFEMHFSHENLVSSDQTGCWWTSIHRESGGQVDGWTACGWQTTGQAYSNSSAGLNFDRAGSGSFGDGTVTIYGLK